MRRPMIFCAFFLMLAAAYLNNVRGPLVPAIGRALNLPYGSLSWLFVAGNIASVPGTLALIPLSRALSDRAMGLLVCALGASGALATLAVDSLAVLVPVAALWGVGIALLLALSNLALIKGTDLVQRARFFCGLHMIYGLGSLVGPAIGGMMLGAGLGWKAPLLLGTPLAFALALFLGRALPADHDPQDMPEGAARLTGLQVLILVTFCIYVAGEVLMSTWMVAYLVDFGGVELPRAASILSGFFLMIGLTRGVCFLRLRPEHELRILFASLVAAGICFIAGHGGRPWAFALAGVLGPFFPLYMARVSRTFPEQARALTLWILGGIQLTLVVSQFAFGRFADRVGIARAYWLPLFFLVLAAGSLAGYRFLETRRRRVPLPGVT